MRKSDTSKIEDRIQFERSSISAEVLQSHSVTKYIGYFDAISDYGGYSRVPPKSSVSNALANSIERQQAHESGAYQPTDWLMVWPTKDIITWAKGREIESHGRSPYC